MFVVFSLLLLNTFYLSLILPTWLVSACSSLGLSCLGLSVLPGLGSLFPFPRIQKNSATISSIIFSGPFSLSSPSGTSLMQMLVFLILPQSYFKLSSFFFSFTFFSSFFSMAVIYTILSSRSFTCSSALVILLLIPSSAFFISVTILFNAACILVLLGLCSSTLAWKIPWTEEPGRLQSMGSLSIRHDWASSLSLFTFMHWRRKWQLTPVSLPGESQGWGSLVGCLLWGCTESDTTEAI